MSENQVAIVKETTALAISIFRLAEDHDITLKPVSQHQGALLEPYCDDKFLYRDIRDMPPDFRIPIEAVRRFSLVYDTGTVRQVVIAEELKPYEEWQRAKEVAWEAAKGTGRVLAMLAAIPVFLAADPKLIAILEDGTWISVAEWL